MSTEPLRYVDVQDEYNNWASKFPGADKQLSMADWAKAQDAEEGTLRRTAGYTPGTLKNISAGVDRVLRPVTDVTGSAGGTVGGKLDEWLGTTKVGPVMKELGTSLPRDIIETLPFMLAPAAGEAKGVSQLLQTGARVGKILGAADAGTRTYTETNNPASGLVSAVTLPLADKAIHVAGKLGADAILNPLLKQLPEAGNLGERAAPEVLDKLTSDPVTKIKTWLAAGTAEAVAGGGVNELSRQAQLTTQGTPLLDKSRNPFTPENIIAQTVGAGMQYTPLIVKGALDRTGVNSEGYSKLMNWGIERAKKRLEVLGVQPGTDPLQTLISQTAEKLPSNWVGPILSKRLSDMSMLPPVERTAAAAELASAMRGRNQSASIDDEVIKRANQGFMRAQIDPPKNPEEVAALASRVNTLKQLTMGLIDAENETTLETKKFQPGLAKTLKVEDETATKKTSSESVKQLIKDKYLPDIDATFLRQQFGESVDRVLNGDDRVAFQQLSQKVANVYLELHDLALERRSQDLTAKSIAQQFGDPTKDIPMLSKFFEALAKVPDVDTGQIKQDSSGVMKPVGMRQALLDRFLHIEDNDKSQFLTGLPNYLKTVSSIADHLEQTGATDWVNTPGKFDVVNRVPATDELGNVVLGPDGAPKEKNQLTQTQMSLRQLVERDANGQYTHRIKMVKRSSEFGGKSKKELNVPETMSLEDVQDPNAGAIDETYNGTGEEFNAPDLSEKPLEPADTITTAAQTPGEAPMAETLSKLNTKLETISDSDLWNTVQHVFAVDTGRGTTKVTAGTKEAKLPLLRQAIAATLEAGPPTKAGKQGEIQHISDQAREFLKAVGRKPSGEGEVRDLKAAVRDYWKGKSTDWFDRVSGVIKALTGEDPKGAKLIDETGQFNIPPTRANRSSSNDLVDAVGVLKTHFRRLGYEPALVDHFTKIGIKAMSALKDVEASVQAMDPALAYTGPGKLMVDPGTLKPALIRSFEEIQGAGYFETRAIRTDGSKNRPLIAMALDHNSGNSPRALVAQYTLSVLVHELIHGVQMHAEKWFKDLPSTPYMRERIKSWQQLNLAAQLYQPAEKLGILSTIAEATIPKELLYQNGQMNPNIRGTINYGAAVNGTPNFEFVNTLAQFLGTGMISGGNGIELKAKNIFNWMPEEVQLFAKGFYRDLSDNIEGLREATKVAHPGMFGEFVADQLPPLVEQTKKMVTAIDPAQTNRLADAIMGAVAPEFASNSDLVQDAVKGQNYSDPLGAGVDKVFGAVVNPKGTNAAVAQAQMALFGSTSPIAKNPTVHIPWYFGRFVPFFTLLQRLKRQGIELGGDVQNVLTDLQPSAARATAKMLAPFLTYNDHGRQVFNADHPIFKLIQGKGRDSLGRKALNSILDWQQDKQLQAFEPDAQGKLVPTQVSKGEVAKILAQVPADQHQAVISSVMAVEQTHQAAGQILLESHAESAATRVGRLIQRLEPQIAWQEAERLGTGAIQAARMNQPNLMAQLMTGLKPTTMQAVAGLVDGPSGLGASIGKLEGLLADRPWFATRQRPGRYIIESVSPQGDTHVDGAQSPGHVKAIKTQLEQRGFTKIDVFDKFDRNQLSKFDAPDQIFEKYTEIEQKQWDDYLNNNPAGLAPDVIDSLRETYAPGTDVSKDLTSRGVKKYLMKREEVPSALGHDYLDNMRDYVTNLAGATSKRKLRQRIGLITNDARLSNQIEFKLAVKDQVDHVLTPTPDSFQALKSFTSAYYLGANLSSMLVEMSQGPQTLVPLLLDRGQDKTWGVGKAYGTIGRGIRDLVWLSREANQSEITRLAKLGEAKVVAGAEGTMTREESIAYAYRRGLNEGVLDHGAIQDINFGQDQKMLLASKFGHGEYGDVSIGQMATDGVYLASQKLLKFYAMTSNFNQKISFLAGLHQGYEGGHRGMGLYQEAQALKNLSQFSGGKANQPGYIGAWSNQNTRATFGLVHTLQQYSMGMVGLYAEMADKSLRNHPELSPVQRSQARKAFATMLVTQVALSGALGVPFVGATLAVLEKVFGVDATATVRQGLAPLFGQQDKEDQTGFAGLMTEIAMSGLPNQMFGVDLASRMGANGILGTSSYSGFDMKDMLGPTPNIIGNMVKGVASLAQGDVMQAGRSLVPQAFKNSVDLAKNRMNYGDFGFRDNSENLIYQPTTGEAAMFAAGLKPKVLSERRKAAQVIKASDDHYTQRRSSEMDGLAQKLLQGDVASAQRWVAEQVQKDPMLDPDTLLKEISVRATDMIQERDPLAQGPMGNVEARRQIAGTFNPDAVPHRSEVDRLMTKEQMDMSLGVMPSMTSGDSMTRAALVDSFTTKGLSRGQATRYADLLGL